MSVTKRIITSVILVAFFVPSLRADEPAEKTDPPAEAKEVKRQPALVVYQQLLEEYQTGKPNGLPTLELLRTWSLRVAGEPIANLTNEFPPPDDAITQAKETITSSMEAHTKRMKQLSKLVRESYRVGEAAYVEVAAVEYYIAEAQRLPQVFETFQQAFVQELDLEVVLPETIQESPLIPSKEIVVHVDAEGKIKVQGENRTLEQLEKLLREEKQANGKISMSIRCDPKGKHRDIVAIIDIAGKYAMSVSVGVVSDKD